MMKEVSFRIAASYRELLESSTTVGRHLRKPAPGLCLQSPGECLCCSLVLDLWVCAYLSHGAPSADSLGHYGTYVSVSLLHIPPILKTRGSVSPTISELQSACGASDSAGSWRADKRWR